MDIEFQDIITLAYTFFQDTTTFITHVNLVLSFITLSLRESFCGHTSFECRFKWNSLGIVTDECTRNERNIDFGWTYSYGYSGRISTREQSETSTRTIWLAWGKHATLESVSERRLLAAYQPRHNSEVQLIIRRQIHSGISGVSGCYEIRAAVKARQRARASECLYSRARARVCKCIWKHVTSGWRRNATYFSPYSKSGTAIKNARYREKSLFRNIISKYSGE